MTASAPPLPLMIVNSGTRWLPEPETFGSKSGRVCRPKAQTGHQPHSFGRRFIVCEPFRRVELSSIDSVFLYVSVALPTQPKARTGTEQLCKRYFQDRVASGSIHDMPSLGPGSDNRLALSFVFAPWLTLFERLKRLGGNEERLGLSVLQQASNGIVKTSSYIRPLALLTLGNEFPSEPIGRIV